MLETVGFAFLSGALVVLSPCTLPVVPGLLAVVSRTYASDPRTGWSKVLAIMVFASSIALGLASVVAVGAALSTGLSVVRPPWSWVPAGLLALAGLFVLGVGPTLGGDLAHRASSIGGRAVPVLTGLAVGAGWTPCATPAVGLGLVAASHVQSFGLACLVLTSYVLGVVAPLCALLLGVLNVPRVRRFIGRTSRALRVATGGLLLIGAAFVATGKWDQLLQWSVRTG